MLRTGDASAEEVFLGRRAELETLGEFAERASTGRGHLVLVAGEAGVGKTRLLEQLCASSRLPVRWGACWSDSGQPPFWPWTQVLRADPPVRPRAGSPLSVLLPEVATADGAAPEPDRFSLHEAVVAALRDTGPGLVVLDDLHWVDQASAGLLLHLARSLARTPLLVVGSYRDTDVAPDTPLAGLLGPLARLATTMSLTGLAARDVAELLRTVTGRTDDALAAEVHLQSDGNALFATELAKLVSAEGGVPRVPTGLAAVIKERLAGFDDETATALEAAAVLGFSCSVEEVGALVGRPAMAALAGPIRTRVLRTGARPGEVRFTHALVRRAILEGLAPAPAGRAARGGDPGPGGRRRPGAGGAGGGARGRGRSPARDRTGGALVPARRRRRRGRPGVLRRGPAPGDGGRAGRRRPAARRAAGRGPDAAPGRRHRRRPGRLPPRPAAGPGHRRRAVRPVRAGHRRVHAAVRRAGGDHGPDQRGARAGDTGLAGAGRAGRPADRAALDAGAHVGYRRRRRAPRGRGLGRRRGGAGPPRRRPAGPAPGVGDAVPAADAVRPGGRAAAHRRRGGRPR